MGPWRRTIPPAACRNVGTRLRSPSASRAERRAQLRDLGAQLGQLALHSREAVLFDPDTGSMFVLNPTAALLWQCLDGTASLGELAGDVEVAFGVTRDEAERDVLDFARALAERGLLSGP